MSTVYRFERPEILEIVAKPKLTVAIVVACRGGEEKLNLVLASLAAQSYPASLMKLYVIDDGSEPPIKLPKLRPKLSEIIRFENKSGHWGKTAATNGSLSKVKEDVIWFVDGDMVFDPDHLAHHMKWHHESDDYVVLGWKRFVAQWSYTPATLTKALAADKFLDLHSESWGKELWEARIERTKELTRPGVEGYRALVGATFSMRNSQWKRVGGYNSELITGEDTELGWRVFTSGLRLVADREAHSWHLGYSTVEENKESIHRHNDPALAQFIPQMHSIRARQNFDWKVATYQLLVDVRNSNLSKLLNQINQLIELPGTSVEITLLAPWKKLAERYSPVADDLSDIREIYNWVKGDSRFTFIDADTNAELSVDYLLSLFVHGATPYYLFVDGDFAINLKDLVDSLLVSEEGLLGVASKDDRRAFALFAPALARAERSRGNLYKNISQQWGVRWITEERFLELNQGKKSRIKRFGRYLKREGKKINSPRQLLIFIKKVISLVLRKVLKSG
jgi:GT2 family glycosyltransferase